MEKEEKQNQRQRAVLLGQDCNSQLEEFTDFLGKVLVLKIKQIHQFINELKNNTLSWQLKRHYLPIRFWTSEHQNIKHFKVKELIEMNKFWRFIFRYDITFKKWTASEKVHMYMNLFGHVIKFCEDWGLSRRFDHIPAKFISRWTFQQCCLLHIVTFERGELFRIVLLSKDFMFSVIQAISVCNDHCDVVKKFI